MNHLILIRIVKVIFCAIIVGVFSSFAFSQTLSEKNWHVTFQTGRFGPVEAVLKFENRNGGFYVHSLSGSRTVIANLPKAKKQKTQIDKDLLAFTLQKNEKGYKGLMKAPWSKGKVTLSMTKNGFKGSISSGIIRGSFSGVPAESTQKPLQDYRAIVDSFLKTVETKVFDPRTLKEDSWKLLAKNMRKIGASAKDDCDVFLGFQFAYEGKPFSHLTFAKGRGSAQEMMAQFDKFRVGGKPASVKFDGDIAILSVKTMIGLDTIELIEAAYKEIAAKSSKALIIDLRGNGGGAFAIKPLIEHVIDKPIDSGYFVTHKWNVKYRRLPTRKEVMAVAPWQGFSLKAWWENVQAEPIIRLQFKPQKPNFNGPVYVLMDTLSASATEMAIDALSASDKVTLIGEKTAGEVLTQSPFDTSEGFQAFIPVGDYYSLKNGRLEGTGIKPNVEVKSVEALEVAKRLARKN